LGWEGGEGPLSTRGKNQVTFPLPGRYPDLCTKPPGFVGWSFLFTLVPGVCPRPLDPLLVVGLVWRLRRNTRVLRKLSFGLTRSSKKTCPLYSHQKQPSRNHKKKFPPWALTPVVRPFFGGGHIRFVPGCFQGRSEVQSDGLKKPHFQRPKAKGGKDIKSYRRGFGCIGCPQNSQNLFTQKQKQGDDFPLKCLPKASKKVLGGGTICFLAPPRASSKKKRKPF